MPKFSLVRILWDSEICRFCSRKCIFLSLFFLSFFFGRLVPPTFSTFLIELAQWNLVCTFLETFPRVHWICFFEFRIFSIFCDFWKLWDLVHSEVIHYISRHARLFHIYFCIISMKSCIGLLYNFFYTMTWIFFNLIMFFESSGT